MSGDRPFARIYYADLERDYPDVYRDDRLFSTYTRLLCVAEAMWPARPEIPRSAHSAALRVLIERGLVVKVAPMSYRIKGMDSERETRQEAARKAAHARWSPPSTPTGNAGRIADAMPIQPASLSSHRAQGGAKNGVVVDERNRTPEEQRAAYDAAQAKLTGVKS